MYLERGNVTIENCSFVENKAYDGPAVYMANMDTQTGIVTVRNTTFIRNAGFTVGVAGTTAALLQRGGWDS